MPSARETIAIALLSCALGCEAEPGQPEPMPDDQGGAGMSASDAGQHPQPNQGPYDSLDERPCPSDGELSGLSYESFGAPFLANYCQGCHGSALPAGQRKGAPPEVTFDDVPSIRRHAARIWARAGDQNATMPPVGGPAMREREKLGAWLACGAPQRSEL